MRRSFNLSLLRLKIEGRNVRIVVPLNKIVTINGFIISEQCELEESQLFLFVKGLRSTGKQVN